MTNVIREGANEAEAITSRTAPTNESHAQQQRYRLARSAYGSHPWYAVPDDGQECSPVNAVWIDGGAESIDTTFGTVSCDGMRRFFVRKRDLVTAIAKAEGTHVA